MNLELRDSSTDVDFDGFGGEDELRGREERRLVSSGSILDEGSSATKDAPRL